MAYRTWGRGLLAALLAAWTFPLACVPPPPDGGGGDGQNDNGGGGGGQISAGEALFAANGCSECHTPQDNNFSTSTIDDIVGTLLGELPHPGGEFGDFTEQEIDDITNFLVDVMTGEDDIDIDDGTESQAFIWFQQVWNDFDQNYSHFANKGVDWDEWRGTHEPTFQGDLSTDAFQTALAAALAELRDIHVWLFDPSGAPVDVYSRPAEQNYPDGYPDRYFPQGLAQLGTYPLRHALLEGDIAYISIESFDGAAWDGLGTGEIDNLFATYRDAAAMVIDVRANNGGNENVAAAIAGHLTSDAYVYGYHRLRLPGDDRNALGDFEPHELQPAENEAFLKPTACLIGERNLSSAEWFVLMMLENPRGITLIGDTTRGSSGNPQEFSLDNGIKYYIPSWVAYRADQVTEIEDEGIPPTPGSEVAPNASYSTDRDFVLERAMEMFGQ